MKVMQLIEEWHAIEGHPGQIDTCLHSLCAEVARASRGVVGADYWPGNRNEQRGRKP